MDSAIKAKRGRKKLAYGLKHKRICITLSPKALQKIKISIDNPSRCIGKLIEATPDEFFLTAHYDRLRSYMNTFIV